MKTPDHISRLTYPDASGAFRRWSRFVVGLALILLLAFGIVPGLQRWGPVDDVRGAIRASGVDASALFYTESEMSCEAEMSIRNALKYAGFQGDSTPAGRRARTAHLHGAAE